MGALLIILDLVLVLFDSTHKTRHLFLCGSHGFCKGKGSGV